MLTKQQKKIVLKAAEIVERHPYAVPSCSALSRAGASMALQAQYRTMFDLDFLFTFYTTHGCADCYPDRPGYIERRREIRVMMLLTFAEIG